MAQKVQQAYQPPTANGYTRNGDDAETLMTTDQQELRRKKRIKLAIYIVAVIIFQIGVITIFSVTVMKVRNPKFRVNSATFDNFDVTSQTAPPINLQMNAQFGVKNTNFGPYKFDSTNVTFYYRGTPIGIATIPKSKASFRSTKKINLALSLFIRPAATTTTGSKSSDLLKSDLGSGILPLTSQGQLSGKVELMLIMKKKKVVNLDCTMDVDITAKAIHNLTCT